MPGDTAHWPRSNAVTWSSTSRDPLRTDESCTTPHVMATGSELILSTVCNATFCESIYDNPFLDSQLTKQQTEVLALQQELNGKHLKIGTYNNYPLSWTETLNNGTVVGRGVAFVIVDILQEQFNFTFEVVLPNNNYEIGGKRLDDSLIGLLNTSKIDMAAAFLPEISLYQSMVTFSSYLDEGVWMMMLKRPKESAAGSGLLAPFETHVWYLILIAVVGYGPCISALSRLRDRLRDGIHYIPLSPSCWYVYGAFIKQGTSLAPDANSTRVLFATWWMFIILLSSFYTANLTAFLTLSKFTLDIETSRDLYKKNYRWVSTEGSAVQVMVQDPEEDLYFLNTMVSRGRGVFRSYSSDQEFLPMVQDGAVLVREQIAIDHLMYGDYLQKMRDGIEETERCTYVVAPNAFMKGLRAFAFPNNTTLKRLFDPVLTYLVQAGIIKFLMHRDLPSTKICPLDLQSKDRRLRNTDLLMTYIIMGIGLAASMAIFIGEVVLKRFICIKIHKKHPKKKSKPFKASRLEDSQPPPYDSLFGQNSAYKLTDKSKREMINGREYWVVDTVFGSTRLIPVRAPSAFLYR